MCDNNTINLFYIEHLGLFYRHCPPVIKWVSSYYGNAGLKAANFTIQRLLFLNPITGKMILSDAFHSLKKKIGRCCIINFNK